MEALDLQQVQDLLGRWGYGVIFLGMLLENAGLPLPGETLSLVGGYAAGSGQLNLLGVIAAAAGGAIVGDNIGYWVGRRAGWPLIQRIAGLVRLKPERLETIKERFRQQAGKAVLLGRFIAVLRILAGPMAGAVAMPYKRFLVCNVIGALLWATTMVNLAWLAGRWLPLEQLLKGVVQFGLCALALVVLSVVIPQLLEKRLDGQVQLPPKSSSNP
jgi:membrane protein DedA with SNARE-associated domain